MTNQVEPAILMQSPESTMRGYCADLLERALEELRGGCAPAQVKLLLEHAKSVCNMIEDIRIHKRKM